MTGDRADRELLFEALAVHLGFVPRHALDDMEAWRRQGGTTLGRTARWARCSSSDPS